MERYVIITVGKTHSGKSTFARDLERQLKNTVVIDQDVHAEFINTYYDKLLPASGPNTFKYAITKTIVDYAVEETNAHLILCNSNRNEKIRLKLLSRFHDLGFKSILVDFDLPDDVLRARIADSTRSTKIFRSASTFQEVLDRQEVERNVKQPKTGEADHLFVINRPEDAEQVIYSIVEVVD
ncbi:ATP-binding protein [Pseudalkalibacillus sp. Hm43]|uniref:ATP-binding protein n=1 Tax=Pseudalkalibacillus sp. Hm43 TaxID=3450742 RepID=UPI003F42E9AF